MIAGHLFPAPADVNVPDGVVDLPCRSTPPVVVAVRLMRSRLVSDESHRRRVILHLYGVIARPLG